MPLRALLIFLCLFGLYLYFYDYLVSMFIYMPIWALCLFLCLFRLYVYLYAYLCSFVIFIF